jgi:tetratricopeptide (TPR) repeat protein
MSPSRYGACRSRSEARLKGPPLIRHLGPTFGPALLAAALAACAAAPTGSSFLHDGPAPGQPLAEAAADEPDLLTLLAAGAEALASGDAEVAATLLDRAVAAGADDSTAHFLRGVAHLRLGELDLARESLALAVERDPTDISSRCVLARACHLAGDVAAALEQLDLALEQTPDDARLHTLAGHIALDSGQIEVAFEHLSRAIDLDPADADAHRGLGLLFADVGDSARAALAFREALILTPDDPLLHSGLGHALRDLDRPAEALDEYRAAQTLEPGDPVHAANIASTLAALGRTAEARRAYEDALAAAGGPGRQRARIALGLAQMLEKHGDLEGAVDSYEAVLADDPSVGVAERALGLLYLDRGEEQGAMLHLEAALDLGELTAEAALQLALLDEQHGRIEQARRCAQLLEDAAPGDPEAALRHAQLAIASSDPEIHDPAGALLILQDLRDQPSQAGNAALWSLSAQALADLGDFAAALDAVDHALAVSETDSPAWRRDRALRSTYLARLEGP